MAEKRRVKAKYRVVGPKKVQVLVNRASMDKETLSLQQEPELVMKEMYTIYFPQGHSIRVDYDELKRLGCHVKPRLVDMDTGDLVDLGGDPYAMPGEDEDDDSRAYDVSLVDQEEEEEALIPSRKKASSL